MNYSSQPPTLGDVVHYVLANGQHRAAEIVNDPSSDQDGKCNLRVSLDVHSDLYLPNTLTAAWSGPALQPGRRVNRQGLYLGGDTLHVRGVGQDEEQAPGTWHWPEHV